jgi:predicted phosphohydrolase
MSIYSISDLHLSFSTPEKSMVKFGWGNHENILKNNWNNIIEADDLVLLPGDLSWALKLSEAEKDLSFIAELPGKKILLKGNHDYWWTSLKKINDYFRKNSYDIELIQYNAIKYKDYVISGVRGWEFSLDMDKNGLNKYKKELMRLDLCISSIKKLLNEHDNINKVIFMMHYPPFTAEFPETPFLREIIKNKDIIDVVVFGHLHKIKNNKFYNKEIEGIEFKLVSADIVDFKPVKII